jgi:hypothetical protein
MLRLRELVVGAVIYVSLAQLTPTPPSLPLAEALNKVVTASDMASLDSKYYSTAFGKPCTKDNQCTSGLCGTSCSGLDWHPAHSTVCNMEHSKVVLTPLLLYRAVSAHVLTIRSKVDAR